VQALAKIHTDTRFLKINVENAPFLVTKLKVQVLPCVISFIDGQSVDRLVGFEGVSYQPDTLKTKDLEARFLSAGVVQRSKATQDARFQSGSRSATKDDEDDDDDEWD
jgi:thioredoxin-like negative regulator of GroEL